jgi:hypothetical protein
MTSCPDCGATIADNGTCRALFDELLAHEYAFPAAFGAVHHLTVAAYYLQHPRGFSRAAIRGWRAIITDSLDGAATPAEFLRRARARSDAKVRIRERDAKPPEGWPSIWPMTVADVVVAPGETPNADGHIRRVTQWAKAIRGTLDALTLPADAQLE